jgi:predicted metal-dependent hydrolase
VNSTTNFTSTPASASVPPIQRIVCLTIDSTIVERVQAAVAAHDGDPLIVATPDELVAAVDQWFPVLVLIDLTTPGDWQNAIARSKLRPHSKQIPIYAFGRQEDEPTFQAARQAGADHVWATDQLLAELPQIVQRQLNPPTIYPDGWDEPLSELARTGLIEFNQGQYFEQHEHLEAAWLAEPRPIRALYQGILQVGVAFLQIERGNWAGALKLLRRGLPRLRGLPAVCQGVQIGKLRAAAEAIHAELIQLGPDRLHEFDPRRFPKIEFL